MQKGLRVLIVDDDKAIRESLSHTLIGDGHAVSGATNAEEALEFFIKKPFPLVITDLEMAGRDGIKLLLEIKRLNPSTEVIIITAYPSFDSAISALRSGAYDYLVKTNEDLKLISSVVNHAMQKIAHITEDEPQTGDIKQRRARLEDIHQTLKESNIRDELTGLYNSRYFLETLEMELIRSMQHGRDFSLILLTLDFLKSKDSMPFRQPEENSLLHELAQCVKKRLRGSDMVARYGDKGFGILLPETTKDGAHCVTKAISRLLENTSSGEQKVAPLWGLMVSTGLSSFPEDGKDIASLIQQATKQVGG